MPKSTDLNIQLAATLGIDLSAGRVTSFTVRARVGHPPEVTVTHQLKHHEGVGVQQFTLQPIQRTAEAPPYDVNWACLTAQLRMQSFVDERARYHQKAMARSFFIRGQIQNFTSSLGEYLRAMLAAEDGELRQAPLWSTGGLATPPRNEGLPCASSK